MSKNINSSKKEKPVKRAYVKRATPILNGDEQYKPFEIEKKPPQYRLNPELAGTLKRIDATIKLISPGEAFVVPVKSKASIQKYIADKWPNMIFRTSKIHGNSTMMRIYFFKFVNS